MVENIIQMLGLALKMFFLENSMNRFLLFSELETLNIVLKRGKKEKGNGSWQTFCQNSQFDVTHALQFFYYTMINAFMCVCGDITHIQNVLG